MSHISFNVCCQHNNSSNNHHNPRLVIALKGTPCYYIGWSTSEAKPLSQARVQVQAGRREAMFHTTICAARAATQLWRGDRMNVCSSELSRPEKRR
mmetsp:Transcript_13432/g.27180  ORF Transcript_13432/g.27180 Transcript_13432/m.27180 type:complete len:96 (+) Transcript_13432:49-336(+)